MAIILLPLYFICLFLAIDGRSFIKSHIEGLLVTALFFCTTVVVITEGLGSIKQITYPVLLLVWAGITLAAAIPAYRNRGRLALYRSIKNEFIQLYKTRLGQPGRLMAIFTALLLLLTFVQGIIYPPNNWDSMTYHLGRIPSWVSHQSVNHYPSHIMRQIYQPPFAEYVIMHVNLLCRGDYFANSVQFFFLLLSLLSIVLITRHLGLSRRYQLIAVLLGACIPEVVLQASSTQNDVVIAFFTLTLFYYVLKAIESCTLKNYLLAGLCIGLGMLTKGTAYVYFAPILLLWAIGALRQVYRTKNYRYLALGLIAVGMALAINASFYYRNYQLQQNILGIGPNESVQYANQKMNAELLLSSIIKNAGLHMSLRYVHGISTVANKAVYGLHHLLGIEINNPAVNYMNYKYDTNDIPTDEDYAANLLHLLLTGISVIVLLKYVFKPGNAAYKLLLAVVLLQIVLFCAYLKWQPWSTRLHVPIFMLAVPLVCYAFFKSQKLIKLSKVYLPLILIYAILVVTGNNKRPYDHHMFDSRYSKYFIPNRAIEPDYQQIEALVTSRQFKNIGLITDRDSWVYPLFTQCFSREMNPIYLNVDNFTRKASQPAYQKLDCVITNQINQPYIEVNGQRLYNKTTGNGQWFIYAN